MTILKVTGVPEQVNIPLKIALEEELFEKYDLQVQYIETKEGTGKMIELLESGTVDLAFTVTDGLIAGNNKGKKVNLIGCYVSGPLEWGVWVHVDTDSNITLNDFLKSKLNNNDKIKVGVSRIGSGSYTMTNYMAKFHEIPQDKFEFVVANNIDGLKNGVQNESFDLFLWEYFTTKPLANAGELKHVGSVITPWPAFSIAMRSLDAGGLTSMSPEEAEAKDEAIQNSFIPGLEEACKIFTSTEDGAREMMAQRIVDTFGHTLEDAKLWLDKVEYNFDGMKIDRKQIETSVSVMKDANLVNANYEASVLWSEPLDRGMAALK